jgi:Glycosyltransferase family 87
VTIRNGALAAGLSVAAGVAACVALAWADDSPVVPGRAGELAGDHRLAWWFLAALVVAFAAYLVALLFVGRGAVPLVAVAAVALVVQLLPLAGPLLLSSDAYTYWDYGRIAAVHGGNPYRENPDDYELDPAFPWVGGGWRDTTSVYGPVFTLASEPIALAAGSSHSRAAWIYKSLAALAVLACAAGAARLSSRKAFALAFVGWNPLLAIHFGGGGHNDAWMTALVLAALIAAASRRRQAAGAAWALAALVKWVPLAFLLLRTIEARATRRRVGHAGFAVSAVFVLGLATWRYGWHWLAAFGPLARNANKETSFAIPHRLTQLGLPHWLALAVVAVGFVAAYAWLAREAWRGHARLGLAAVAFLLAAPYLAAWYVVWALPLAAAEDDRTAQLLSLVLCAYLLRQTVPV